MAVFLVKCLQQTSFFGNQNQERSDEAQLTDNEVFVGKIIFRLLNILPTNCHDISEFETPVMDSFVPGCKKVSVGKLNVLKLLSTCLITLKLSLFSFSDFFCYFFRDRLFFQECPLELNKPP